MIIERVYILCLVHTHTQSTMIAVMCFIKQLEREHYTKELGYFRLLRYVNKSYSTYLFNVH